MILIENAPYDRIYQWLSDSKDSYWRLPNVLNGEFLNGFFVKKGVFYKENERCSYIIKIKPFW